MTVYVDILIVTTPLSEQDENADQNKGDYANLFGVQIQAGTSLNLHPLPSVEAERSGDTLCVSWAASRPLRYKPPIQKQTIAHGDDTFDYSSNIKGFDKSTSEPLRNS